MLSEKKEKNEWERNTRRTAPLSNNEKKKKKHRFIMYLNIADNTLFIIVECHVIIMLLAANIVEKEREREKARIMIDELCEVFKPSLSARADSKSPLVIQQKAS